jgi:ABC-type uncharacterized transport system substrate-binding protein
MFAPVVPIGKWLIDAMRRHCRFMPGSGIRVALFLLTIICSGQAVCNEYVAPYRVLIITDETQPAHRELLGLIRNSVGPGGNSAILLAVKQVSEVGNRIVVDRDNPADLVVAVGTRAYDLALAGDLRLPVFALLIPKVSFDEISKSRLAQRQRASATAIYLEQPPSLQIELARQIFPRARTIGLALGPGTAGSAEMAGNAARRLGLVLRTGVAGNDSMLSETLDELLPGCEALIGVVDPLIIGRTNAQNVLLAAYRHRVPVIGPSLAFVQAGALAAAYSTNAQVVQDLAGWLERWRPGDELPAPGYANHFSIAVNYRVAESFGIQVDKEADIQKRILKARRSGP